MLATTEAEVRRRTTRLGERDLRAKIDQNQDLSSLKNVGRMARRDTLKSSVQKGKIRSHQIRST